MSTDLNTWERKYYRPGGGDPFLFYYVYGEFLQPLQLSLAKYRSQGVPQGLTLRKYDRERHAETLTAFLDRELYLGRILFDEQPGLAELIQSAPECLILRGTVRDSPTLDYMRDTVGLLSCILDSGGVAVFDPQAFRWWSPEDWRSQIFEPSAAVPRHHVLIIASEEEDQQRHDSIWYHTRGMRKFGRPDLSAHNVPPEYREGIIDLCNRFIEFQAFGGVIDEGQEIRMHSLPSGMTCHHAGDLHDPDFNNVHVEIILPN
jgi:hypothetical protein